MSAHSRSEFAEHTNEGSTAKGTTFRQHELSFGEDRTKVRAVSPVLLSERMYKVPDGSEGKVRNPERWWLKHGAPPYLLLGDASAFAVANAVTTSASGSYLILFATSILMFALARLYRSRLCFALLNDLPYIAAAVVIGFMVEITLAAYLPGLGATHVRLVDAFVLLVMLSLTRFVGYSVIRTARKRRKVAHRTLILGTGEVGARLASAFLDRPEYGLLPMGFIDNVPPTRNAALTSLPVLGKYADVGSVIRQHGIRAIFVAFGSAAESDLVDVLTTCEKIDIDVEVFVVPRLMELHKSRHSIDDNIWGIPVTRRRRAALRSPWWKVKRLIDIVVSTSALVLLAPVLGVCAVAVRLELGRGVLFRQKRLGKDARPFQILKFRSLSPSSETESETNWNIKQDSRLGKVGRFMRASSLDELPQLWNILRGDMSLVGPRPERPHFVDQFSNHIPRYEARHRVPSGLTGWSQAHGLRGDTSIHDRVRFDNYYVENWSLALDLKIVLMTVGQVLGRRGG